MTTANMLQKDAKELRSEAKVLETSAAQLEGAAKILNGEQPSKAKAPVKAKKVSTAKKVGEKISELIKTASMTRKDLIAKSGGSADQVSNWLSNHRKELTVEKKVWSIKH